MRQQNAARAPAGGGDVTAPAGQRHWRSNTLLSPASGAPARPTVADNARSLDYRADVDGLRAVAVLAVVLFHAYSPVAPGGFVGVDIFFVISGFLISRIILTDMANDSFTIVGFYRKRVRRIFPALIVVLAATFVLGWWMLFSDEFASLGASAAAGGGFVSNVLLWREAGYFKVASELRPLLHLWSLGIEEQFYLIWPVMALLAWRRTRIAALVGSILVVSFGLNVALVNAHPLSTFYLPLTRFWELMAGGAIAVGTLHGWRPASPIFANAMSLAGLALVVASIAVVDGGTTFPGWWALPPVLGTVMLIAAGPTSWINRRLLSWPILVAIGLISYPLYLWHWPLLSLLRNVYGDVSVSSRLIVVAVAFLLAALTYRFVERPLRFSKSAATPLALVVAMLVVMSVGLLVGTGVIHSRADGHDLDIVAARNDWAYPEADATIAGWPVRVVGTGADTVLFVGDSRIEQYFPRIQRIAEEHSDARTAIFATHSGCPALPGVTAKARTCGPLMAHLAQMATATGAKTIVIGSAWNTYFREDDGFVIEAAGKRRRLDRRDGRIVALDSLRNLLKSLTDKGVRVYVILSEPDGPEFAPSAMVERTLLGGVSFHHRDVDRAAYERSYADIDAALRAAARGASSTVISPRDYLCTRTVCETTQDGWHPRNKDESHLRASFVRSQVTFLDDLMLAR